MAAVVATAGIVLAALYILLMYKRMMTGPKPELAAPVRDITRREKLVVAPLIAAFLVLGFYPEAGPRHAQPGGVQDAAVRRRHRPEPPILRC